MALQQEPIRRGDLDLLDVVRVLWVGRWWIVITTIIFSGCGIAYALMAAPWYRAEAVLVPVAPDTGLAGNLAQFSGLASLAGIDLRGGNSPESVAVLKSREFLLDFIQRGKLIPVLFNKDWDPKAGDWKSADPTRRHDIRDAVKYFDEHVRRVDEDKKNGTITLSVAWRDPFLAAEWCNSLSVLVNDVLRTKALAAAQRNIDFLRTEMAATSVVPLQQTIGRVMESEMQKLLLARGSEEFAFKIVDRAIVPKKPVRPRKVMIAVGSCLAGGLLSVIFVLVSSGLYGDGAERRKSHRSDEVS